MAASAPLSERLRSAIERGGIDAVTTELASWSGEPAHKFLTADITMNSLAMALYREKKEDLALAVFELNAPMYPDSFTHRTVSVAPTRR